MRTGPASLAGLIGLFAVVLAASALAQEVPRAVQPVPYQPPLPTPPIATPPPPVQEPQAPVHVVVAGGQTPAPGPAVNPGTGDDVVIHLRDGAALRGSLVEMSPGDHATIVLATGTNAQIAWSGIDRVERIPATAAAPAPPAPVPASPPSTTTVTSEEPAVWVHIQSKRAATLERKIGHDKCDAPCDRWLPLNGSYRIIGPDIHSSGWFPLEGSPGDRVVINVSPGLKSTFKLGTVIGGAGLLSALVGAYVVDIANASGQSHPGANAVGGAFMLGGLAVMAVGGSLMWANRGSSSSQEVGVPVPAPEPPRREAIWRAPDTIERSLPQAQELRVLQLKF
jgi:hypothetical protein